MAPDIYELVGNDEIATLRNVTYADVVVLVGGFTGTACGLA